MELENIINEARKENCIVIEHKGYYNIVCDFMTINNITFSDGIQITIKEIKETIYFGRFWIDKNDIKSISFTGRKDYNIL